MDKSLKLVKSSIKIFMNTPMYSQKALVTIYPLIGWWSISPISSWKKVFGKCCLKVLKGIVIWTCNTNTSSIGLSYWIGNIDISSIGTNTYSIKFKLVNKIKLTSCFDLIGVGTNMFPIENNHGS